MRPPIVPYQYPKSREPSLASLGESVCRRSPSSTGYSSPASSLRGKVSLVCDKGFTLVEVLVVMAIITVLVGFSAGMIVRALELPGQVSVMQAERFQGLILTRTLQGQLRSAARPLGIVTGSTVNPASIGGDQVVFEANGLWYRLYYSAGAAPTAPGTIYEVGGASTPTTANGILPSCGPNQSGPGLGCSATGTDVGLPLNHGCGSGCVASTVILGGVVSGTATVGDAKPALPLCTLTTQTPATCTPVFSYVGDNLAPITENGTAGPDFITNGASSDTFYATGTGIKNLSGIDVTAYINNNAAANLSAGHYLFRPFFIAQNYN
jgi:prepilin-type N-terminal cleavage/methylation domain-containing protein